MATAGHERPEPRPLDYALDAGKLWIAGDHVLEEAQLAVGPDNPSKLAKRHPLVGDRAQHEGHHGGIH